MYTTGIITYNTLPISNKSNICFEYEREKNCFIDYPTREVDVLGVPYQRKWISLDKNMDYHFQIEKKKFKKMQRMQYKHMNHSARGVVCERSHARHFFNRLKRGGGSIRYWYESALNVIFWNCVQRCVTPLTWETVPFNLIFAQTMIIP